MNMGWGSSLRLLRLVCVFARVFAGNVAMLKVHPIPVRRNLKTKVSKIVVVLRANRA